ncbi:MAG: hypothetical protein ACREJ3_07840, partial [Polyangiaceae bacterium]
SVTCSFFVQDPECNWVANNLLEGMRAESVEGEHGGIRIVIETSAVLRLARFVVDLGEAACPETPVLARAVAELARGALKQANRTLGGGSEDAPIDLPGEDPVQARSGG